MRNFLVVVGLVVVGLVFTSPVFVVAQQQDTELEAQKKQLVDEAIHNLIELVDSTDETVKQLQILNILVNSGDDSVELLKLLVRLTENEDENISRLAGESIAQYPAKTEEIRSLLLDWLKSNETLKVKCATQILANSTGVLEGELVNLVDRGLVNKETKLQILQIFEAWGNLEPSTFKKLETVFIENSELQLPIITSVTNKQDGALALPLLNRAMKLDDIKIQNAAIHAIESVLVVPYDSRVEAMVSRMMDSMDTDGNGFISEEEDRSRLMSRFDTNGDKRLTRREISAFYSRSNRSRATRSGTTRER